MKKYKRVNIEISNICNLRCNFCPEVHREKKVMSGALFRKIIEQVSPLTEEVCLHLMGEPLGHPQLSEFVDTCGEHQVPVNLTTNGTLLDERRKEILLRTTIRQVNFSVHSFEANFGEGNVGTYLKKIFDFTRKAFESRPDLYVNYRIWDLNDPVSLTLTNAKIRQAIEEEYRFKLDPSSIDLRRRKSYRIVNRLYLNLDSRFEWPSLAAPIRSENGYCHGLSNHFGIHADGTVVPCCLDKEAVLKLGDVGTQTIVDILASKRSIAIAEGFARNRCIEELCQKCDFIKRFDRRSMSRQGA